MLYTVTLTFLGLIPFFRKIRQENLIEVERVSQKYCPEDFLDKILALNDFRPKGDGVQTYNNGKWDY